MLVFRGKWEVSCLIGHRLGCRFHPHELIPVRRRLLQPRDRGLGVIDEIGEYRWLDGVGSARVDEKLRQRNSVKPNGVTDDAVALPEYFRRTLPELGVGRRTVL